MTDGCGRFDFGEPGQARDEVSEETSPRLEIRIPGLGKGHGHRHEPIGIVALIPVP